jgi:hypothetical protein
MRRKVFVLAALMALVAICGAAYAATSSAGNKYTASVSAKAKGSKSKPAATSVTEKFGVKNLKSGQNAYPVTNIKTTIGGIKVENASAYATCSASKINAAGNSKGWNKVCSSKSQVASGPVNATIYTAKDTSPTGDVIKNCKLTVNVYNDGKGKLTFFLTTGSGKCGPLNTGAAKAWTSTYKSSGSSLVLNVPIPADASTNAGGLGAWAAINSETLNFKKLDTKKKPLIVSTGCTSKRSWKMAFTASTGSKKVSNTVSGKSGC